MMYVEIAWLYKPLMDTGTSVFKTKPIGLTQVSNADVRKAEWIQVELEWHPVERIPLPRNA